MKVFQFRSRIYKPLQVSEAALLKRHKQGWLELYSDKLDEVIEMIKEYRKAGQAISIGYLGNVVDLWLVFHLKRSRRQEAYSQSLNFSIQNLSALHEFTRPTFCIICYRHFYVFNRSLQGKIS